MSTKNSDFCYVLSTPSCFLSTPFSSSTIGTMYLATLILIRVVLYEVSRPVQHQDIPRKILGGHKVTKTCFAKLMCVSS
jgi:hypothetical protein